jgi:hypothetical protein
LLTGVVEVGVFEGDYTSPLRDAMVVRFLTVIVPMPPCMSTVETTMVVDLALFLAIVNGGGPFLGEGWPSIVVLGVEWRGLVVGSPRVAGSVVGTRWDHG